MTDTPLNRSAAALVEIALPLAHLLPLHPAEAFTVEIHHSLGAAATEALAQWDDTVLQTQGVERDRYAHNLPNADVALSASERLALALQLALDLPSGTFDANQEGTLQITLQPFHAKELVDALNASTSLTHSALEAPEPRAPRLR